MLIAIGDKTQLTRFQVLDVRKRKAKCKKPIKMCKLYQSKAKRTVYLRIGNFINNSKLAFQWRCDVGLPIFHIQYCPAPTLLLHWVHDCWVRAGPLPGQELLGAAFPRWEDGLGSFLSSHTAVIGQTASSYDLWGLYVSQSMRRIDQEVQTSLEVRRLTEGKTLQLYYTSCS